ncbi:hypothetical protein TRVL_09339 [Trypanosoma vivax]|nr:hypothetical protein TRVL_09339 [Trypanosoma vivax]
MHRVPCVSAIFHPAATALHAFTLDQSVYFFRMCVLLEVSVLMMCQCYQQYAFALWVNCSPFCVVRVTLHWGSKPSNKFTFYKRCAVRAILSGWLNVTGARAAVPLCQASREKHNQQDTGSKLIIATAGLT